jgi:GMP synthase-like glutamine amidotransferase
MSGEQARELWVIDPSTNFREDEGVAEILHTWEGPSRVFRPSLCPGDGPTPATGHAAAGIVLMGSAVSVKDDLPWLNELTEWVRPVVDGQQPVPLLAICFGHQLIAHIAGAPVGLVSPDGNKRLGVEQTRFEGSRLVPGRQSLRVVVSHREEVKAVPENFVVTATRDTIAVDGLEHRSLPVFGYQFHPEAREEFAENSGIDTAKIDDRLRADSRQVLDGFLDLTKNHSI